MPRFARHPCQSRSSHNGYLRGWHKSRDGSVFLFSTCSIITSIWSIVPTAPHTPVVIYLFRIHPHYSRHGFPRLAHRPAHHKHANSPHTSAKNGLSIYFEEAHQFNILAQPISTNFGHSDTPRSYTPRTGPCSSLCSHAHHTALLQHLSMAAQHGLGTQCLLQCKSSATHYTSTRESYDMTLRTLQSSKPPFP